MLDFYFIADNQSYSSTSNKLPYAGGIEEEEFELAQQSGLIEPQADYYGKFRWSSEQVKIKLLMLASCPFHNKTELNDILNQAKTAGMGLMAFGD